MRGTRQVLAQGITVNLLNPELTVFFVAFLPQFVPTGSTGASVRMAGLSAVFVAMTFATFVVYAALAALLRDRVLARPRVLSRLRRVFAATFVALSARLATEHA